MTPQQALSRALTEHKATGAVDSDYVDALVHASECLHDMFKLLRYIRAQLPSREPELEKLITSQLLKGCEYP